MGICSKCKNHYTRDRFLHGHNYTNLDKRGHKCLQCKKMFCYKCFRLIVNTKEGYCVDCFTGLDMIKPLNVSNPSIRAYGIQLIETIDFSPYHVARKIGTFRETLEHIKKFFEDPNRIPNPNQGAFYSLYVKLQNRKDLKDLEIYFGYMNDKYHYYNPKQTKQAIREFFCDTIFLVSKDKNLIQKLHGEFATEILNDNTIVYVGTQKEISNEAIFDEVDVYLFPDGRSCLRLWVD